MKLSKDDWKTVKDLRDVSVCMFNELYAFCEEDYKLDKKELRSYLKVVSESIDNAEYLLGINK